VTVGLTMGRCVAIGAAVATAGAVGVSQAASAIASVIKTDHLIKRELNMRVLLIRIGAIIAQAAR
jgi:hypothetical protein